MCHPLLTRILLLFFALLLTACGTGEDRIQGYMEQEPINMSSNYSGALKSLDVRRGDTVLKGQVLFTLDPSPELEDFMRAQSDLAAAQSDLENLEKGSRKTIIEGLTAEVAKAQASLDIAIKKATRFQLLFLKNAIDAETNDEIQAQVQVEKAALADAQANLAEGELGAREDLIKAQQATVSGLLAKTEQARWALDQKTVLAPIEAQVLDTYYNEGEIVGATKPVLSLLNPKDLYAVFFVTEHMLGKLCLNGEVYISHDVYNEHVKAKISYISPQAEYTPPVIYSRDNNSMLVFKIEATLPEKDSATFYYGQPVDVYVPRALKCHE